MSETKDQAKPTATVMRSEDGQRWIVQIDAVEQAGHTTVYINDGDPLFDGDPEVVA